MAIDSVATVHAEAEIPIEDDSQSETVGVKQYTISGYGADFDVEGLVRRLDRGDIEIPEFQRTFVWNQKRASRFIESLLMGLPVPGIFLYRDRGSQTLRVIDGQQRLLSLQAYYLGKFPGSDREFCLTGLESRFEGYSCENLPAEDRRRLNDSIIHASIIQQESPDDGGTSQYSIFERLNTTSTPLSPQEIRTAIYGGAFNKLLVELNGFEDWRTLVGPPHRRKRDQELILRFFALFYELADYKRTMKEFLNEHMKKNQNLEKYPGEASRNLFYVTVSAILSKLGPQAFRPERGVNAALTDALMVGIARRMQRGPINSEIRQKYDRLLECEEFRDSIFAGTSQSQNVKTRIQLATEAFATVE